MADQNTLAINPSGLTLHVGHRKNATSKVTGLTLDNLLKLNNITHIVVLCMIRQMKKMLCAVIY